MLTNLNLSINTIRNLQSIHPNVTSAIELMVRYYQSNGFPTPYIYNDRAPKQSVTIQLTPYVIGILDTYKRYGMSKSQVIDWLTKISIDAIAASQPTPEPVQTVEAKPQKVRRPKTTRIERSTKPKKQPTFHNFSGGPVVKKAKLTPTRKV